MKIYYLIAFVFTVIVIMYIALFLDHNYKIKRLNANNSNIEINENSLPILETNKKYIEQQTNIWIKKRKKDQPCYGFLEKDKIIMGEWIEHFKIRAPKIHYKEYHTDFSKDKLSDILSSISNRLVIKISHLQSSYGIFITDETKHRDQVYIDELFGRISKKFKGSFVCNHDRSDPPTNKEIMESKNYKNSYYKLYETVEPGVLIQDYFNSFKDGISKKPIELKVLLFGGNIVDVKINNLLKFTYDISNKKYKKVYEMARDISKLLGSILIRVDMFVKKTDNPYIPYLNEISLSPNGGLNRALLSNNLINNYRKKMKNYTIKNNEYITQLFGNVRKRSIPIEYYFSDADFSGKKIQF